jgi:hypothetical protein
MWNWKNTHQLPFLDFLVTLLLDISLEHFIDRKPSHADTRLHATSHHSLSHKRPPVTALIEMARVCNEANQAFKHKHTNYLPRTSGYFCKDISKTSQVTVKNKKHIKG